MIMKLFSLIMLVLFTASSYAQYGTSAIKLGFFSPSAAQGGFIIGYEGGKEMDEYFFLGWSIDWFRKSYTDRKLVDDFNNIVGSVGETNELRAKTNIHDFPLMVSVAGRFPVAPRTIFYVNGGIGAELLYVNYRNFNNPDQDESKVAFDFNWRLGIGTAYELGTRSEIFGEITYHNASPSWEFEVDTPSGGKRTFERIYDMSGVMGRIGLRFYY
jgi:hypothetical protein